MFFENENVCNRVVDHDGRVHWIADTVTSEHVRGSGKRRFVPAPTMDLERHYNSGEKVWVLSVGIDRDTLDMHMSWLEATVASFSNDRSFYQVKSVTERKAVITQWVSRCVLYTPSVL